MNDNNMNNPNGLLEFEMLRQGLAGSVNPTNTFEVAHLLLQNSPNTSELEEIDKEIKLANLDETSKKIITNLVYSYQDSISLKDLQQKKYEAYISSLPLQERLSYAEKVKAESEAEEDGGINPIIKDNTNFLRKVLAIATISRGVDGFERKSQNTTIQQSGIIDDINTKAKNGMLKKVIGGF